MLLVFESGTSLGNLLEGRIGTLVAYLSEYGQIMRVCYKIT